MVAHKGRTPNIVKVPNSTFLTHICMYYIRSLFYLLIRFYCAQVSYYFFNLLAELLVYVQLLVHGLCT
jgi:hypothetical protein